MPNFDDFVVRHGEFGVQALVERIERYEGIRPIYGASLEERWNAVMNEHSATDRRMVA
jgi:hypothetical protein